MLGQNGSRAGRAFVLRGIACLRTPFFDIGWLCCPSTEPLRRAERRWAATICAAPTNATRLEVLF